MGKRPKAIVIGSGISGWMAAICLAEAGIDVDLVSNIERYQANSVCVQDGIGAALNTKGEDDSDWKHFEETIYRGHFLGNQEAVREMCKSAPPLVHLLTRMGAMFCRTREGFLELRQGLGSLYQRVVYAQDHTGKEVLYILGEQVRYWQSQGRIRCLDNWEFLSLLLDNRGICRGILASYRPTLEIQIFRGEATLICTGGYAQLFATNTASLSANGAALGALFRQGLPLANLEFVLSHPTTLCYPQKALLMGDALLAAGAKLWTYRQGEKWYFIENQYSHTASLPLERLAKTVYNVIYLQNLGVEGSDSIGIYLDCTGLDKKIWLENQRILQFCQKFLGVDPRHKPVLVHPAVYYCLGGILVDKKHSTQIKGVFAAGEAATLYHGAGVLGGNPLLSAIYGATVASKSITEYLEGQSLGTFLGGDSQLQEQQKRQQKWFSQQGEENPFALWQELRQMMDKVAIARSERALLQTREGIVQLRERLGKAQLPDSSRDSNRSYFMALQLENTLDLAEAFVACALSRKESRGAHWRLDFPQREDEEYLATSTICYDGLRVDYQKVELPYLPPRPSLEDFDFQEEG
ncbi:MAG: FAD-binding protein [Planctomycetota bacterium]|nr:MAG: FAD-binding protein [Planctomycetota bacterium]